MTFEKCQLAGKCYFQVEILKQTGKSPSSRLFSGEVSDIPTNWKKHPAQFKSRDGGAWQAGSRSKELPGKDHKQP